MTSELGGWLDLWGDNVVHVAVFYGLSVGLYKDSGRSVYLSLGWAAVAGTLVSAGLASYQTYRKGRSSFTSVMGDEKAAQSASSWERRLVNVSDALARRDFIYGVVILALLGHLEWFLWSCAVGVNLYAAVLILLFFSTR